MPLPVSPAQKRNALWPLRRGSNGWQTGTLARRYAAALQHLYRTKVGEIPWAPEYGTRIDRYRTQGVTEEYETEIIAELTTATQLWVPDIRLIGIRLEIAEAVGGDDEQLNILVEWGIPDAAVSGLTGAPRAQLAHGPVTQTITV